MIGYHKKINPKNRYIRIDSKIPSETPKEVKKRRAFDEAERLHWKPLDENYSFEISKNLFNHILSGEVGINAEDFLEGKEVIGIGRGRVRIRIKI